MDLDYVGGLTLLPMLGRTEVLSTVLLECWHPKQPNLVAQITAAGIVTVDVLPELVEGAVAYADTDENLSLQDRQCLLYARGQSRILITGDLHLREAAKRESVPFHGSVWLVEEAHRQGLVHADELCRWLAVWPLQSRRLPRTELVRLQALLGCGSR